MMPLYSPNSMELEVPAGRPDESRAVADVEVSYENMATRAKDRIEGRAAARYSASAEAAKRNENRDVMVAVVEQIATRQSEVALALRDQGELEKAQAVLTENAAFIAQKAVDLDSEELQELAESNRVDAQGLEGAEWEKSRKRMRESQAKSKTQRKW